MPEKPTNQQLIGMTPSQILGIMGGAGQEYEEYLPQYNRERENIAREKNQFGLQDILRGSQQAKAKSGFAGGGAIDKTYGKAREGTLQGFQSQLEGFYSQYASDVYSALGNLANLEAFSGSGSNQNVITSLGQSDLYGDNDSRIPTSEQEENPDPTTTSSTNSSSGPPSNPTLGQTWTDPSGRTFTWDGSNWV